MKNYKIKIVTGPVHSGKTTNLFKFINTHASADGILAPIVNEKRRLYHISTRIIKDLEVDTSSNKTLSVGNFFFLKESFDWANEKLIMCFENSPPWLIIDELGKLELQGEGLHLAAQKILSDYKKFSTTIILVIRDYLVDIILDYYNIKAGEYEFMEF